MLFTHVLSLGGGGCLLSPRIIAWAVVVENGGLVCRRESFLPLASLPQECEQELASLCHSLFHQSLIPSWDQGEEKGALGMMQAPVDLSPSNRAPSSAVFCQALGSAGDQSRLSSSSHTTALLQQLFPPLLDALREPKAGLLLCQPPGETSSWGWPNRRTAEDISFLLSLCSKGWLLPEVLHDPSETCPSPPQALYPLPWGSAPCRQPCSGFGAELSSIWQHGPQVPSCP